MRNALRLHALALAAGLVAATGAQATEGGGSIYPVGVENFGCCALPPPGLYGMVYAQHYTADTLRDDNGDRVAIPGFKVRANVVAPRLVWMTNEQVAGGGLAFHAIVPVVNLKVSAAGLSQTKNGLGDIDLGTAVAWHHSPQLHTLAGVDLFLPTGEFDKKDLANIGRNYWTVQAIYGVSYLNRAGWNADAKIMYNFNDKNRDTDYRSGQELIVDYSAGWGFGNGWTAGVGGYLYQQTTNDRAPAGAAKSEKGRAFSIGPSVRYDSGKGWFATVKYEQEMSVRNRAEGEALWFKAVFPI